MIKAIMVVVYVAVVALVAVLLRMVFNRVMPQTGLAITARVAHTKAEVKTWKRRADGAAARAICPKM